MKAQELSVRTVIIAALALIVLIIIIAIFTGRIRVFGGEARSCTTLGGDCSQSQCGEGYVQNPAGDCGESNTNPCCVQIIQYSP